MEDREIKKINRKALPVFLLIVVVSLALGGILGIIVAETDGAGVTEGLKAVAASFGIHAAPWLLLVCALAEAAVCALFYRKGKKLLSEWDGEDEAVSDQAEEKLSYVLGISDCAYILSFFLLTATYSARHAANFGEFRTLIPFFTSLVSFVAILVESILFQQKAVDAVKKTNPEKNVSVYDVKFQKKWLDSCDEAEKLVIGKCAYKAFAATNKVCIVLAGLLAVGALIFDLGLAAPLAVCVIWFVNQLAYFRETMKYAKAGKRIS